MMIHGRCGHPGLAAEPRHHQGQVRVLRQGRPRVVVALARRQRAERDDPALRLARPDAAAAPARRARARRSSPRAATRPTSSPSTPRRSSTCARPPRTTARSCCGASRRRAEGAATATGCTAKVTADAIIHDPLKPNFAMAELFAQNLERIDFPVDPDDGEAGYGSTDCGNVSQALPTIHPYIRISPRRGARATRASSRSGPSPRWRGPAWWRRPRRWP